MTIPQATMIPMAALLAFLAVSCLAMAIYTLLGRPERRISQRLKSIGTEPDLEEEGEGRFLDQEGDGEAPSPAEERTLSQQKLYDHLVLAGYRGEDPLRSFMHRRLILTAILGGAAFLVWAFFVPFPWSLWMGLVFGALGFLVPKVLILPARIRRCRQEIVRGFPDILDLIVVCIEAGLSLDASLLKVSEERSQHNDPLGIVFQQLHNELLAGKPRAEALRDMANRVDIDEVQTLVAMLIQSERLGTGVGHTLRIHSDLLRTKRFIAAEEHSGKAPIKLLFPLIFCIFPSVFIIVLGPVLLQLITVLGTMVGG